MPWAIFSRPLSFGLASKKMNKQQFYIRYKKLLKVKDTKTAKIGRGQDFEALINDVLEDENILLKRSYHTRDNRSEQIDGAIEILNRVILFEVKWVEKNLAASELYAFLGGGRGRP